MGSQNQLFLFFKVTYMVGLIAHEADVSCTGKQRRVHPSSKWSYNSAGATNRAKQWWTRLLVMLHSRCLCRGRSCSHRSVQCPKPFLSVFDLHLVGVAFGGRRCPVIECRGERFDHTLPPGDHSHHLTRQKQSILTFHHHYYP